MLEQTSRASGRIQRINHLASSLASKIAGDLRKLGVSMYVALIIAAILIIGFVVCFARSKRQRQRYQDAVERRVNEIFSAQDSRPDIIAEFTYGIPSFRLRFRSDKDKEYAVSNGLTEQFLKSVQKLCCNLRPRGEAFKAELAVAIYSMEDEKRWAQEAAALRMKKN